MNDVKSNCPKKDRMNEKSEEKPKSKIRRKTKSNQSWESPKEIKILKKPTVLIDQNLSKKIQNPSPNSPTSYEQTHLKFVPIDGHENVGWVSYKKIEKSRRNSGLFFF